MSGACLTGQPSPKSCVPSTARRTPFQRTTTYRLETNLYAVSDGGLVWSGRSDTVNPDSIEDGISSLTQVIASKLREEGLIR